MRLPIIVVWLFLLIATASVFSTRPVSAACSGCTSSGGGATACTGGTSTCVVTGTSVSQVDCVATSACSGNPSGPNTCYQTTYNCVDQASANACCGIAPPPPPPGGGGGGGGGGTPPPAAWGYGCSGPGCVWMSGGAFGGDRTCGNYSCTASSQTCSLTGDVVPQPVETSQGVQFKFTEGPGPGNVNRGYVDVDFSSGGGAVNCPVPSQGQNLGNMSVDGGCNNNNGQTCSWTFNCNATSTTNAEYQTFIAHFTAWIYNYSTNCSIDVPYVVHGCSTPSVPSNLNPVNNATLVSVTPTFTWTQTSWGTRSPWSVMVYLYQGPVTDNTYAVCYLDGLDVGAPSSQNITAPMSCFVWANPPPGAFQGQSVGTLNHNQTYTWTVVTYSTCGSTNKTAAAGYQTFITLPKSYFKTFGGIVTALGTVSDSNLNYTDSLGLLEYISQKSP